MNLGVGHVTLGLDIGLVIESFGLDLAGVGNATSGLGHDLSLVTSGLVLGLSTSGLGHGLTNSAPINITGKGKRVPDGSKPLLQCLRTVPISRAEAERRFSEINLVI